MEKIEKCYEIHFNLLIADDTYLFSFECPDMNHQELINSLRKFFGHTNLFNYGI